MRLIVEQVQLAHQVPAPSPTPVTGGDDFVAGGVVRPGGGPEFAQSLTETLSRMQDKAQSILEPLLLPTGVTKLKVNGLGVEPGGKVRVDLSAHESEITDDQAWAVACVAVGKELKASVRIVGMIELDSIPGHDLHFARNSSQLTTAELRKATRLLAPWKDKGVRVSLIVPQSSASDLNQRRISFLRRRFEVAHVAQASPEAALDKNVVQMRIVQVVNTDREAGSAEISFKPAGSQP